MIFVLVLKRKQWLWISKRYCWNVCPFGSSNVIWNTILQVFPVTEKLYVGLSGLASDVLSLQELLQFKTNLYKLKEEREIKPESFSALLSSMLYEKRFVLWSLYSLPFLLVVESQQIWTLVLWTCSRRINYRKQTVLVGHGFNWCTSFYRQFCCIGNMYSKFAWNMWSFISSWFGEGSYFHIPKYVSHLLILQMMCDRNQKSYLKFCHNVS